MRMLRCNPQIGKFKLKIAKNALQLRYWMRVTVLFYVACINVLKLIQLENLDQNTFKILTRWCLGISWWVHKHRETKFIFLQSFMTIYLGWQISFSLKVFQLLSKRLLINSCSIDLPLYCRFEPLSITVDFNEIFSSLYNYLVASLHIQIIGDHYIWLLPFWYYNIKILSILLRIKCLYPFYLASITAVVFLIRIKALLRAHWN